MKVFVSWSGEVSHKLALALRGWLPSVIQSVEPFVSSEDIVKGSRWSADVADALANTNYGVICLTPENLNAAWLLFEAGALSKVVGEARVSPLLLGLSKATVKGPLAQFQMTEPRHDDVKNLVWSINTSAPKTEQLEEALLARVFEKWWSELEAELTKLTVELSAAVPAVPLRTVPDMLQELLSITRGISNGLFSHREDPDALTRETIVRALMEPPVGLGELAHTRGALGRTASDILLGRSPPRWVARGLLDANETPKEKNAGTTPKPSKGDSTT